MGIENGSMEICELPQEYMMENGFMILNVKVGRKAVLFIDVAMENLYILADMLKLLKRGWGGGRMTFS